MIGTWIAGSLDRWIAGSLDRRIAGSPDRRIAERPEAVDQRAAAVPIVVAVCGEPVVPSTFAFCLLHIVDNLQIIDFNVKHGKHPPRRGAGADSATPSNRKD
ncbi:hypothetical protein [Burkholderia diffusa]|uniref:hypothetical protein n=1 Tax=Burkholderia diffusa TaxID=488732 RepID=UPI001245B3FE|nr:hypothetical protein [Burkholderia diffusa]